MRAFTSYGIAFVLIALVAIWFVTGTLVRGGNGPEQSEQPVVTLIEPDGGPLTDALENRGLGQEEHHAEGELDPALSIAERSEMSGISGGDARSVRVRTFTVLPMNLQVPLRGHIASTGSVTAVAETSGIVDTVAVEKGQAVAEGDSICTLDQGTRLASVANARAGLVQAEAALALAQTNSATNESLRDRGLASVNSADSFASALRAAEAGIEASNVAFSNAERELDRTEIRTRLPGVVLNTVVEVGTFLSVGDACATIMQLDPMLFVGSVPQARIDLAQLGMPASIQTITGRTATGAISFISPSADAATRTFEIEIEFPNPDGRFYDGLSAQAEVDMGSIPAQLLPQSILTLDENGVLGVRAVEDDIVVFYPITILSDTRDGIWASGLPPRVDVIILGQEYVKAGQVVDATNEAESIQS